MLIIKSYIAPSTIHGLGVFSVEALPKGTRIWELMEGIDIVIPRTTLATVPEMIRLFFEVYAYPHPNRDDQLVIDADNSRFINHSEEPNTEFSRGTSGYTLRDIAEGEEITCNYYREFSTGFTL